MSTTRATADIDPQALYIVTVKFSGTVGHDPRNKQTAACPVSDRCTDATGKHHSFLATGSELTRILEKRQEHVTRAESTSWPT